MLMEKLQLQAVCQTDLEVKFGLARFYKSQVHFETELRSMRSNFEDAKSKQKSLESEISAKDILIDSLWEDVKQEKEDLEGSLNASNAIIEELNYRLALI
ncbi:hypothetical protein FRC02_012341 [Tulasnella sp. 418]|nr:hypothetical protein FRC02_012341 [Tulasnella sp. 418]